MKAIRGAITVNSNTEKDILNQTMKLLETIIKKNWLTEEKIISILFSATKDLTKAYPAKAARQMGLTNTAMDCHIEMEVEGGLKKCIRVLMHVEMNHQPVHVYLEGAKTLRLDWSERIMQIAIDGPSGAGKSTIAKAVARELGIVYVDTGAMYRSIGLLSQREGVKLDQEEDISRHQKELIDMVNKANIELKYQQGKQMIYLNGEDISSFIRTEEIGERASKISTIKQVRQALVKMQQEIAGYQSVVMDGRDIGTVVLPNADYKIYLTASAEVRGKRRYQELKTKGINIDINKVIEEIKTRDQRDQNRVESPLRKADDAIEIDTSNLNIEEVTNQILKIIQS